MKNFIILKNYAKDKTFMKKKIISWLKGKPIRGTPLPVLKEPKTVMPVKGMSLKEWENGGYSKVLNGG